ncbi:hypothetical protein SAMN05216374_0731 [Tardiphaga sp. OK246]|jgi:hypothetical protein|uniref:DUF6622 family protein n=2 Tax=Nitrobacteraceae TaxID=41294 RepID=UPI000B6794F6|nr:DUF6622 family protein [Tardiphaga sp. OK246]SNS30342.1 hypothetical protein SAMN05216374_0731 [Tardiphaga sp. OK246]
MDIAWRILTNTPIWVFALLALLIWLGSLSLRPRKTPLRRLLIVPMVFLLMGLSRLIFAGGQLHLIGAWLAAAIVMAAVALWIGPGETTVDRQDGTILRPGSWLPLIRNLSVFLLQYAVAVATAMKLGSGAAVPLIGQLVSGACAGYFLGWTVGLIRRYRAETHVAVA